MKLHVNCLNSPNFILPELLAMFCCSIWLVLIKAELLYVLYYVY